jgi:cell cycle sensor histidine kinase DivJ
VIRQLDNQAERAGVKLRLKADEEVWAQADARAVRQIWQNLVSNAIKYSDSGSAVVLECGDRAAMLPSCRSPTRARA